jgi:hypothetical protein
MKIMRSSTPFISLSILASVEGQFAAATGNQKAAEAWRKTVEACEKAFKYNGLVTRWMVQRRWKEAARLSQDQEIENSISMY